MTDASLIPDSDPRPADVLRFWFGPDLDRVPEALQHRWFHKDPAFDADVLMRFLALFHEAEEGRLERWRDGPLRCLAYVLLLDQFPRNMFRDTRRAFATDAIALAAARDAVTRGFDREVPPLPRAFFYLPFEHSESAPDQDECVRLFRQWEGDPAAAPLLASSADYARRHQEVIRRFGRFPHRNAILGRKSTPAELAFLQQPGSSF